MPTAKAVARKPLWYLVPVRVVLVTIIVTLLLFAVSLFLGILGIIISSYLQGGAPNMAMAYRYIAAPVAVGVGAMVLVCSIVIEVRHYRQAKTLAGIERASKQVLSHAPGASGGPLG
jgi:hypothetical protein